jgi:hypothetical protein
MTLVIEIHLSRSGQGVSRCIGLLVIGKKQGPGNIVGAGLACKAIKRSALVRRHVTADFGKRR